MAKQRLTMKEAAARDEIKKYGLQSSVGLLKWLFEGRVVRTVNGEPPDSNGNINVSGGIGASNAISFLTIYPADWKVVRDEPYSLYPYPSDSYVVDGDGEQIAFKNTFQSVSSTGGEIPRSTEGLTYKPLYWILRYDLPEQYAGKIVRCLGSTIGAMPRLDTNSSEYADLSVIMPELRMYFGRSGTCDTNGKFTHFSKGQVSDILNTENAVFLCKCSLQNEVWGNGYFTLGSSFEDPYTESPPQMPTEPLILMLAVEDPELPCVFRHSYRDNIFGGYTGKTARKQDGTTLRTRLYLMRNEALAGTIYNSSAGKFVYRTDEDYAFLVSFWGSNGYRSFYSLYEYEQVMSENGSVFSETLSDKEVRRILGGWEEGELDDSWNARAADRLAHPRQIALSGDVSGDAMFDGTEDITIGTAVDCLTTTEIDTLMAQSMALGG